MKKISSRFIFLTSFLLILFLCNSCFLFHSRSDYKHLHECTIAGDTSCVLRELAKDSPMIDSPDDAGMTPLHIACAHCKVDVLNLLLELGADVNKKASGGATPIHIAAQEGCLDGVKLLILFDANIDVRDNENRTPLGRAIEWGQDSVAIFLKAHGGRD